MGAKSRGGWNLGMCLKDCTHQGKEEVCKACIRFSNLNSENPMVFENKETKKEFVGIGKESLRFYPHFNEAFGKFINTKGEYLSEMKKGGFEPYSGEAPKQVRKKADMSETNRVIHAIQGCTNKDGSITPGGNLKKALMDRGVIMSKESLNRYHNKVREMTRG